jgi:hypothetical protein
MGILIEGMGIISNGRAQVCLVTSHNRYADWSCESKVTGTCYLNLDAHGGHHDELKCDKLQWK